MTCEAARALFSAHVDGVLEPAAVARLNDHLSMCPACQRELARFQQIVGALRSLPEGHAPADFLPRVMAQLPREPWPRRLLRSVFLPLPLKLPLEAAAVMLVGILTVVLYRGSPQLQLADEAPTATVAPSAPDSGSARSETPSTSWSPSAGSPEAERRPTEPKARPAAPLPREADGSAGRGDALEKRPRAPSEAPRASEPEHRARPRDAAPSAPARRGDDEGVAATRRDAPAPAKRDAPAAASQSRAGDDPGSVSQQQLAARPTRSGTVEAVLRVKDRAAADRALPAVLARAGATLESRGAEGAVVVILVPSAAFTRLANDLKELGDLTFPTLPDPLPDPVRVTVRIGS